MSPLVLTRAEPRALEKETQKLKGRHAGTKEWRDVKARRLGDAPKHGLMNWIKLLLWIIPQISNNLITVKLNYVQKGKVCRFPVYNKLPKIRLQTWE